ncbi:hypothetical protein EI94DRAFT_1740443 [Lactarius quietus]|nr:hypothetical protein EI94DRAFT_1740443 [Lactarius quietus]
MTLRISISWPRVVVGWVSPLPASGVCSLCNARQNRSHCGLRCVHSVNEFIRSVLGIMELLLYNCHAPVQLTP